MSRDLFGHIEVGKVLRHPVVLVSGSFWLLAIGATLLELHSAQ